MNTTSEFNTAFVKFFIGLTDLIEEHYTTQFKNLTVPTLSVDKGRKYARIVVDNGVQKHVHCFIDMTNGNVLKAAGWKAPAKHARGNIFNDDAGMNGVTVHGARYM